MSNLSANSQIQTNNWKNHFLATLVEQKMVFEFNEDNEFLSFPGHNLFINLVNIDNSYSPQLLAKIQVDFTLRNQKLIHLWEDVWLTKPTQVLFRLKSLLAANKSIHGRKTIIRKIDKPEAEIFLNKNHLQGFVSSRYKFGLYLFDDLVAVATFSALRKMNHTDNYKSIELIRFAVKGGFSVSGGLSKLLKHVNLLLKPNDVMTYADKDWSSGAAYFKLGFKEADMLEPQYFILDKDLNRSLKKNYHQTNIAEVFNTGSLKFILKF